MELCLNHVSKQYAEKEVVQDINLHLTTGVYGLLGANGAGKTTLIRMICGILKPTQGEILWNGVDVSKEAYREVLGYLPQNFGYYPEFSAQDFLYYMASLKGLTKFQANIQVKRLLELVSLTDAAKKKIKTFSGGMKQRLGIAQALLNNPSVLILDEPTVGLDPKERIRFRNLIAELGKNRIVLLSTHIVSDIESIAGTILVMKEGRLHRQASLEELLKELENCVFECTVDAKTAQQLEQEYTVVNKKSEGEQTVLRLVSLKKPCQTASAVTPVLEDFYLHYFS